MPNPPEGQGTGKHGVTRQNVPAALIFVMNTPTSSSVSGVSIFEISSFLVGEKAGPNLGREMRSRCIR